MTYTLFPSQDDSVLVLYKKMYKNLTFPRNEVYLSSPLTSGGAISLPALSLQQVIALNSKFAEVISHEIDSYIDARQVTLPHMIGKRKRWKELDYMFFWMFYLSGISFINATKFINYITVFTAVNLRVFSDYSANKQDRAHEYQLLLDYFLSFISKNNIQVNPVSEILLLPDYKQSLGCCFEKKLGMQLKIPTKEIYLNSGHPRFSSTIAPYAPWILMKGYDIRNEVSLSSINALVVM